MFIAKGHEVRKYAGRNRDSLRPKRENRLAQNERATLAPEGMVILTEPSNFYHDFSARGTTHDH